MADIKITFKDGTVKEFKHHPRPGGSYMNSMKLEAGFVVVIDEWGSRTAFPSKDVQHAEEIQERRW